MSTALQGQVCEIAAALAFEREGLLPGGFERVVVEAEDVGDHSFDQFLYYLMAREQVEVIVGAQVGGAVSPTQLNA